MALQIRSPAAQIKKAQYAHASATTAKLPIVVNDGTLIPLDDAGAGAQNSYVYEAEISGAGKTSGQAWAIGQKLYFDPATGLFTTTAGSLKACGSVIDACGASDTVSGLIAFRGL